MKTTGKILLPILLTGLASAQDVGTPVPEIELEGYSQTAAESYDDFIGRAVLLEFFAYW